MADRQPIGDRCQHRYGLSSSGSATTNSVLWVAENTLGVHCPFCTIWRVMALAPLVCMAMKCKFTLNK